MTQQKNEKRERQITKSFTHKQKEKENDDNKRMRKEKDR